MKILFDSKTKIIVAGFLIAFVTIVSILAGTTDLFKGFVNSEEAANIETGENINEATQISLTEKLILLTEHFGTTQSDFDDVLELTEAPGSGGYDSYDLVVAQLSEYAISLDSIESEIVTFDPATFESLSDAERSQLSALLAEHINSLVNMKVALEPLAIELTSFLSTVVFCPIGEGEPNAVTFNTNHSTFSSIIDTFNTKAFFAEADLEDLKAFIINLSTTNNAASDTGCVDFSSHTSAEIEEESQILTTSFSNKSVTEIINFGNAAISTYNTNVVTCYRELGCDSLTLMTNIDSKAFCTSDQTFDAITNSCTGAVCPNDELIESLDLVFDTLNNYADTPEAFDTNGRTLLALAVVNLDITTDITTFDYSTEANDIIAELNLILAGNSNDLCEQPNYEQLSISGSNPGEGDPDGGEGEGDGEPLECPVDSLAVPELDSCVCPDESVIATGEECPDTSSSEGGGDDELENQSVVCENGLVVEDVSECPAPQEPQVPEETNEDEEIVTSNTDEELHGSSLAVTQFGEFGLTSNTQANVLASPIIQGETGSEAIAVLLVLLVGMFNVYVWVK